MNCTLIFNGADLYGVEFHLSARPKLARRCRCIARQHYARNGVADESLAKVYVYATNAYASNKIHSILFDVLEYVESVLYINFVEKYESHVFDILANATARR